MAFVMLGTSVHKAHHHKLCVQMEPSTITQELKAVPTVLEVTIVTLPLILGRMKIVPEVIIVTHSVTLKHTEGALAATTVLCRPVLLFLHAQLVPTGHQ